MIRALPFTLNSALLLLAANLFIAAASFAQTPQNAKDNAVTVNVDFKKEKGHLKPIWAFFGYDEPNYTYMKDGKKLLTEMSQLSKAPVYIRMHHLLITGDGTPSLKWGSTNAYTEDANGNPIYSWTTIDSIFDNLLRRGLKPIAQIGFMPKAMSTDSSSYRTTGHRYPPKDYKKFAALVYEWVKHAVTRYGKKEVESWYWELWNEPNIDYYWKGTTEEFIKLYDYTADAVKRALPTAIVGGPEVTNPGGTSAVFLKAFLDHVVKGKNYATGKIGSPLDLITFHSKGSTRLVNGVIQMNMGQQLRAIDKGFEIVASYPTLKKLPIIIGESDPESCAACPGDTNPQYDYRNGTMYSSYTAASFSRLYDLAAKRGVNLVGAVTWAFEFENQPIFKGYRDLATNGIDKPVFNVFRMYGLMQGNRVEVSDNLAYNYRKVTDSSVRAAATDVNALAAKDKNSATIMIWNYHDNNVTNISPSKVSLQFKGLPATKVLMHHYRIDKETSNAYEVWKKMGSPKVPSKEQYDELESAGALQLLTSPQWVDVQASGAEVHLELPFQAVSLLQLTW